MVVEERHYVLHTSASLQEYLEIYTEVGLPIQTRVLGGLLGSFTTEFGTLNELTHLWGYSDLEDRRVRRAALAQETEWQRCLTLIRPMIFSMTSKILYPTTYSPIQ